MAKTDPVPNRLFWQARRRVDLTRGQLADAANQEPAMATCDHELMTENFIGRIEQGRIGGNMCAQRLAALCATLGVTKPSAIGLSAGRRHPTDAAPARPRTSRNPAESPDDVDGTGSSASEPNVLFRAARERFFGTREALADAANAHLGAAFVLSANDIGKIERGVVTWPRPPRRAAFRKVLNVETDAELGFFSERSPKLAPVTDEELERARLAIFQRQSKAQTERESSAMARPDESATTAARESGDEPEGTTLFDAMLRERHWQTPKAFRVQFTRAARELAEIEKDPEFLRLDDLSDRQFFRWRHGARPRPYACRILEHLFGTPIENLLRHLAPTAGGQTTEHQDTWVDLGAQLAACRNEAGYTQGEFALLIYSSRSTIANVETGRQRANRNFWLSCDTACGTDGLLVRGYDRISCEAARKRIEDRQVRVASAPVVAQEPVWDSAASAEVDLAPVNGLFRSKLKRLREERGHSLRQLSRLAHYSPSYLGHLETGNRSPTPGVAGALDTVLKAGGKLAALVANPQTLHVRSMKDGDIFLSAMHSFRVADRQVGGGYLYDTVIRYVRTEVAPKLFDAQPGSDGEFAFRAAATLTEMSGWMAHDAGRDTYAERHFKRSLDFVMASKDRQLAAHVFTSMSHLANHMGRPGDAITFVGQGQELLTGGPRQPELEARMLSVQARNYAALGDRTECVQLLTRAEWAISSTPDVERSLWVSPFDAGSLASEAAKCFYALGDTAEARRQAERIIELRPDSTRSRAFGQLMLAAVLIAQGRPDEACAIAAEVVSATQQLGSYLVIDQLRSLKNQLHACRDSEAVAEFLACLDETLRQRSWLYNWSVSEEELATNGYDSKW